MKHTDLNNLPEFMKHDGEMGKENIRDEDCAWFGEQAAEVDPDAVMQEYEEREKPAVRLLISLLLPAERQVEAINLLLRTTRKRGRAVVDDEPVLCAIAESYFRIWLRSFGTPIDVAPIIRESRQRFPNLPKTAAAWDSEIRRIRRKWNKDKDYFLVRVTFRDEWEQTLKRHRVARILADLRSIGIVPN